MRGFFNYDNGVWRALGKFADLVMMNIFFIVFSLPIVTIGASKTALYAVTRKMAKNEEGYITKEFISKFKENFKYSTYTWLCYLGITFISILDLYACSLMEPGFYVTFCRTIMIATLVVINMIFIYAINMINIFENSFKNMIKNSLILSVGHFPYTVLILIVELTPVIAILFLTQFLPLIIMLMLLVWFALIGFINAFLFERIFKKYIEKESE